MKATKVAAILLLACCLATSCQTTKPAVSGDSPGAITHIVLIWLKPETSQEARRSIEAGSRALDQVPGVYNLVVGNAYPSDRPIVDDSFDLALSMQFNSKAAMDAYVTHPDHQAYVGSIKPHVAKLLVYDLTPTKK